MKEEKKYKKPYVTYPDFLKVVKLDSCDSTNSYLKNRSRDLQYHFPVLVHSREQTRGRGRGDREWFSPSHKGLYASFGFFLRARENLNLLSLAAGIAVAETLETISGEEFVLKWPNDVLYRQKKVSGILTENTILDTRVVCISGIGINLNQKQDEFPGDLGERATSLRVITGREYDIDAASMSLSHIFLGWLDMLERNRGETVIHRYNRLTRGWREKRVRFFRGEEKIEGIFVGIDDRGGIILADDSGTRTVYYSGEIAF